MRKWIALILFFSCKNLTAFSQDLSDCLEHGFRNWTSNNVLYLANKKASINTSELKDEFIERYKKFGHVALEMNTSKDSSFGCLNYSIVRQFIIINEDSTTKSVVLHFSFSQNLYDQILQDYQKKKTKIVKWGLDIFSENTLDDYSVYLEDYSLLVYTGMDNQENRFLAVWLSLRNRK